MPCTTKPATNQNPFSRMRLNLGVMPFNITARSSASAELAESAAVALGGASCGGGGEVHEGLAFFGGLATGFAAGVGFLVERLGDGGGAAEVAEGEDVDFELAAFGADLEAIADADVAAGFDRLVVGLDAVEFAGAGGLGAGFEEACRPEPFVDAGGHSSEFSAVADSRSASAALRMTKKKQVLRCAQDDKARMFVGQECLIRSFTFSLCRFLGRGVGRGLPGSGHRPLGLWRRQFSGTG